MPGTTWLASAALRWPAADPDEGKTDAPAGRAGYHPGVAHTYPPLNIEVRTPRLTLAGASDQLLERLVPLVRAGVADAEPWPFDDPSSFYADSPEREWQWLRRIWAGRARVSPDSWRLYFAVVADGEPVGMQDLTGKNFTRTSPARCPASRGWPPAAAGGGLGREMRAAILQLAFAGLGGHAKPAAAPSSTTNRPTAFPEAWATNRTARTGTPGAASPRGSSRRGGSPGTRGNGSAGTTSS